MIRTNRRQLLAGSAVAAIGSTFPVAAMPRTARAAAVSPDLFVGTGGHGHTFPGATMPFGMVQLSPDTNYFGWDACSGYHQSDRSIMGFSHTHLSGTGIGDMLDVLVVPTRGPLKLVPGTIQAPDSGYRQRYSEEHAEPGYYRVKLETGVVAELTATERTGLHRYTFPSGPAHLLIDFAHCKQESEGDLVRIEDASLALDDDGLLTGSRQLFRWAEGRRIHFAMQISRRPDRVAFFGDGDAPSPTDAKGSSGHRLKVALFYDDAGGAPIEVKTGISAVDVAGARAALDEAPGWPFDHAVSAARRAWGTELDRLRVSGGSAAQRTILASALYHTLMGPTLFSDRDGRYVGLDHEVRTLPPGERAYSAYSLWDTYRALHPLMTLLRPDMARRFIHDLIRQTQESPFGPPTWPLQGYETGCMNGWHSVVVLAEAHTKGIEADYAAAWPNIRRRSFDADYLDNRATLGRADYMRLGYVPADTVREAVSRTQEYAFDDHAAAVIARVAGAEDDAMALKRRSGNWRNVIDPKIGFARPRFADGRWWSPYDPVQLGHMPEPHWRDYTEANGWQATFLVQHDLYGLIAHFGGDAAYEAKLDSLFAAPSTLPDNAPPDIAGLVGQYAHGNEPDQHAPYLYAYVGAPHKTQAMVRRLLTEMYKDDPDGVIGNDDCGQMSAWFILSALGFYPVDPTTGIYVFGSPLFDTAELQLGEGKILHVHAIGNAPDCPYVQSVRWNGQPWTRNWIAHRDLIAGGALEFTMGTKPSPFGTAREDRPPSPGGA